jgi:hypothetical protein
MHDPVALIEKNNYTYIPYPLTKHVRSMKMGSETDGWLFDRSPSYLIISEKLFSTNKNKPRSI